MVEGINEIAVAAVGAVIAALYYFMRRDVKHSTQKIKDIHDWHSGPGGHAVNEIELLNGIKSEMAEMRRENLKGHMQLLSAMERIADKLLR